MLKSVKWTILLPAVVGVCGSFAAGQLIRRHFSGPNASPLRFTSSNAGAGTGILGFNQQQDDSAPVEVFKDVLGKIRGEYVDRVDDEKKLGFGAVKTMLASLDDSKTRFLEPTQRKVFIDQLNGKYAGIGAAVAVVKQKRNEIDQRRLAIVAPLPGSPAEKAGLEPGDFITEIDGHWVIAYDPRLDLDKLHPASTDDKEFRAALKTAVTKLTDGVSLQKALDQLAGKPGKTLKLTIERAGMTSPQKIEVATDGVKLEPVEFKMLNDRVAYLRVTQFNDAATRSIATSLSGTSAKSIVLDLRNNFGGAVTKVDAGAYGCALTLLSKFTLTGTIGALVRNGNKQEPISIKSEGTPKYKVAVLVNGGTANLAELVASALKVRSKAAVIGSNTFGDAIFQKLVSLNDGAAMTIASGKMLGPDGLDFSGKGVQPDVTVKTFKPASVDAAVTKAVSELGKA